MDKNLINNKIENVSRNINRESGLELLRIIVMVMITFHHAFLGGGFIINNKFTSTVYYFLSSGGKIAVNVFVLITGYFMINKKFKVSRLINILFSVLFYSIFLYLIAIIFNIEKFSIGNLYYNLFPISNNQWWFVLSYLALLLISPFLNRFLHNSNKKVVYLVICVLFFYIVLLPYINNYFFKEFIIHSYANSIVWFALLYIIAGCIRTQNINIKLYYLFFMLFAGSFFQFFILLKYGFGYDYCYNQGLGNFTIGFSLFLIFKKIKFSNKYINTVASTTFGIYLIQEHNSIKNFLWKDILSKMIYNFGLIGGLLVTTFCVFIVCFIIELIRILTIQRYSRKLSEKIELKLNKVFNIEKE